MKTEAGAIGSPPRPAPASPSRKVLGIEIWDLVWLALPVGFGLYALRGELINVPYANDSSLHEQMVRWADSIINAGRVPLDGWYSYFQLGNAHFPHYQSLPHILTAYLGRLIGPEEAFRVSLYVLLSFWPVSVYVTARLFSLGRTAAVVAALLTPLVVSQTGMGFEWTSYTWNGWGLWSQLWGMVLVGPAMGLSWRAVRGEGSLVSATGALGLTLALHFLTGYLALISFALWVLARPKELLRRAGRGLVVVVGAFLSIVWVMFPLVRDNKWLARTEAGPQVDLDSFGAPRVLGWLVSGEIFDAKRWPVLTVLVAVGIGVCIRRFRREESVRCILGLFTVSVLLYFGRPTLGPVLKLLPLSDDLFLSRFISGVHLSGLLLAGVAGAFVLDLARTAAGKLSVREQRLAAPVAGILLMVLAAATFGERWVSTAQGRGRIIEQLALESGDGARMNSLIARAQALGGGRIFAGARLKWGSRYVVGLVPGFARLADQDVDAVGFTLRTTGLASDIEYAFDESNLAQYELLNVRYLILPEDREPAVPATLIEKSGRHVLWRVETTGYLKVVDTLPPIAFDNKNVREANEPFLSSDLIERGLHPTVRFAGGKAAPPTALLGQTPDGPPGQVTYQSGSSLTGTYVANVQMQRKGVVMLKASFDPRSVALVDGERRRTFMVAPTFAAVEVEPGAHRVQFEYRPFTNYPLLFLIAFMTLAGIHLVERRRSRA